MLKIYTIERKRESILGLEKFTSSPVHDRIFQPAAMRVQDREHKYSSGDQNPDNDAAEGFCVYLEITTCRRENLQLNRDIASSIRALCQKEN